MSQTRVLKVQQAHGEWDFEVVPVHYRTFAVRPAGAVGIFPHGRTTVGRRVRTEPRRIQARSAFVIFDSLLGMFSIDMGIDLGTCNTLVCVKGEGIVLNEPSIVAVKKATTRALQNGNAAVVVAKQMLGKTPGSVTAIRPLKH